MAKLIKQQKSIIPACDVSDLYTLEELVKKTCKLDGIGAYKVGFELVIVYGLKAVVEAIRKYTELPVIYDHQKAGNDIPKMGKRFATSCKESNVDSVIIYPFAGPTTEECWIKECQDVGLHVMVGGYMTHENFVEYDNGFISNGAPEKIYEIAVDCGIKDFVVPYNKPYLIYEYSEIFRKGDIDFTLYAPGFTSNMNDIPRFSMVAGSNWHIIIGEAIYDSIFIKNITKYLIERIIREI